MRLTIAVVLMLGLTALAGAQVSAPSVSIEAANWETRNDVVSYSGFTMDVAGVVVRAEAAEYRDRQFSLLNATVTIPSNVQIRSEIRWNESGQR